MIKYFICLLLFLGVSISCSNRNQELEKFQINSAEISAAIVEIDSVVNSLKSEGKLQFLDKEVLEPADMAWNKFKQLCNSQKYKEAYEFYKRGQGDILVSLSHSSSRYTFLAEVLKPLMTHYETPDSMAVKYLKLFQRKWICTTNRCAQKLYIFPIPLRMQKCTLFHKWMFKCRDKCRGIFVYSKIFDVM